MIKKNKFTIKILLLSIAPIFILFVFLQILQVLNSNAFVSKTSSKLDDRFNEIYTNVAKVKSQNIIDNLYFQKSEVNNLIVRVKNEKIGQSGFAFLIWENGDILNLTESNARFLQLRKKEATQSVPFNLNMSEMNQLQMLASEINKSAEFKITTLLDNDGTEYIITFQQIKEDKLAKRTLYLSLVMPLSDIYSMSYQIKKQLMSDLLWHVDSTAIVSIIILLIVSILAIFFALKETKQIRLINDGILNIKKRNFTDQIKIISSDDLGDLAQTFNEMTTEIQKTYQDLEDHAIGLEEKVNERTQEIENKNRQLKELVVRDHLTGLFNRTKLDEVLDYEYKRSKRHNTVFGVIMVDIDFFKKVNDTHGHQAGDTVLCEFATLLEENSRETDTVGRWGGEEFLIIVENIDKEAILKLAEKLRICVDEYKFSIVKHKTASFGVSIYQTEDEINKIVARADIALYKAKHNGRNRVEFL